MQDAHEWIAGRELDVLRALGIPWKPGSRRHIQCPFPDHDDHRPSWRWDDSDSRWYCSCGSGSVFDAFIRMRGGDFSDAKRFAADVLGEAITKAESKPAGGRKPKSAPAPPHICPGKPPAAADLEARLRIEGHETLPDGWYSLGQPSVFWLYLTPERTIYEVRARYDSPRVEEITGKKKEVLPWIWSEQKKRWINKAAPRPRPLYNLPELLADPDAPVLFVEGEKTARTGAKRFEDYIATTSSGGTNQHHHTDYTPLKGRRVFIWPDNDHPELSGDGSRKLDRDGKPKVPPGAMYAEAVAQHAHDAGAAEILVVDVPADWPHKWDLADEPPLGAGLAAMLAAAKPWHPPEPPQRPELEPASEPQPAPEAKPGRSRKAVAALKASLARPGPDEFQYDEEGKLYKNEHNVLAAFAKCGIMVSYDDFAHDYHIIGLDGYGPSLNDDSLDELYLLIQREFGLKPSWADFERIALAEARRHRVHPVCAYLDAQQEEWDGVERVDEWLCTYLGAVDDPAGVNRAIGRKFLLAAVRRVRKPGTKFDMMLVLEGPQGSGKSSSVAALCPDPGWFSDSVSLHLDSKSIMELIAGKWLVEIGELAGVRRADVEHVKALISRQADEARLAYDRMKRRRPRQCVFIATTNETNYLLDETGNRRFLPVKTGSIDLAALRRDRDQLWAEAAHFEAKGESLELPKDVIAALAEIQRDREVHDEWEEAITSWLDDNYPISSDLFRDNRVTIMQVATSALGFEKTRLDSVVQKRIAKTLKRAGWMMVARSNGKRLWSRQKQAQEGTFPV